MSDNTVWEFSTRNYRVALEIMPEDLDPADSFEFQEDIDAVRSGAVEWFQARVVVYGPDGEELGSDSLGGCAYATVREFYTSHRDRDPMNRNCSLMRVARGNVVLCHYFPGMVTEAVAAARAAIARRSSVYGATHA